MTLRSLPHGTDTTAHKYRLVPPEAKVLLLQLFYYVFLSSGSLFKILLLDTKQRSLSLGTKALFVPAGTCSILMELSVRCVGQLSASGCFCPSDKLLFISHPYRPFHLHYNLYLHPRYRVHCHQIPLDEFLFL